MAVTFEFRRHSIKDGPTAAMIGPKGYALAREVGRVQLRGKRFDAFYASSYWRTHQTLAAFSEGAGDFVLKLAPAMPPVYLDDPEIWALWTACRAAEKRGEDLVQAAFDHDAPLVSRASGEIASLFRAWAPTFQDGSRILVVGHSPHMELLVHGLTGAVIPSLKECQGFRVSVVDGAPTVECFGPDLDPSDIRRSLFP